MYNKQKKIETTRCILLSAAAQHMAYELEAPEKLFAEFNVAPPPSWPPPLNDQDSYSYFLNALKLQPELEHWAFWYVFKKTPTGMSLIGNCGFKSLPDKNGLVEIGYSVIPEEQSKGYCTEAIAGLIKWAANHGVKKVCAETFPSIPQSIRVMEKNEMIFVGEGSEENTVKYERVLSCM